MWNGKKKAITLSFDDGVWQDERLIRLLDKYGLKATFNLNSGCFGSKNTFEPTPGHIVCRDRLTEDRIKEIYKNHEVAVHTLTHPNLVNLPEERIIHEVKEDQKNLERVTGKPVVGMAYPSGGVNNDDRVADVIKKNTNIRYARTTTVTHDFKPQDNLLRFNPTLYWREKLETIYGVIDRFFKEESEEPMLLYIWGHAYELDYPEFNDEIFESICQKLAGHDDVYYCTNAQAFGFEE